MQAPVSAPRNDSLTSYRDIAANRTTVARATTWRFGEVAEFPSSSLEGEAAQPVGRYVGSYVAYRTGVYEVKTILLAPEFYVQCTCLCFGAPVIVPIFYYWSNSAPDRLN